MTAFDRIEPRMPELLTELAHASVPDYFDDMLRQTGRARQRPAWASLERWLPMDVVARPVPFRAPALRPLLILLLILAMVAGGLVLFAGSQRPRLPEPYGPARNGLIVTSTDVKNIVTVDPATGAQVALIEAPTDDVAPWFSPDGQRILFMRLVPPGHGSFWVANADGSNPHEVVPKPVDWAEWSGDSKRIVATRLLGGPTETSIVNVDDGTSTVIDVGMKIEHPFWRPGHDQIVFSVPTVDDHRAYYLVDADGTDVRRIEGVSGNAVNDPTLSPDGSTLAYATWGTGDGTREDIHVLDIVTGKETVVTPVDEYSYVDVHFSPDGTKLLTKRFRPDGPYQLAVIPADGRGEAMPIGPEQPLGGAADFHHFQFSPDGTQVLVYYGADASTWLLEVDGFGAQQLPVSARAGATWQRLAP
jgi:Tol biopolymer transport system component